MTDLTLGIIGTSRKKSEKRAPIHPAHIGEIPSVLRARLAFEHGYGEPFGTSDADLASLGVALGGREELLAEAGVVLLPKPVEADLHDLREGGILWGWPHCVQQSAITQVAIERRQTLIAWEAMFVWKKGVQDMHLFYRNNEMAGYCSVIHALACAGLDGHYGEPLRTVVLSFGSVSRGAIRALRGRGLRDIAVYTQRPPHLTHDQVVGCSYGQMVAQDGFLTAIEAEGHRRPLADILAEADVIVNGILQDTERPLTFLSADDVERMKHGALIIDVSCDEGMGFPFARPTSFAEPTFHVDRMTYYGVDHSPSYLWRSATWEISRAVVPYLDTVLGGPAAWERDDTIASAIEIRDGHIQNPRILSFQERAADWPHARL